MRILLVGCADGATIPTSTPLPVVAAALRDAAHDASLVWLTTTGTVVELDPCFHAAAVTAALSRALVETVAAARPDALVLAARDVPVFAAVAPHPRVMIVDDDAAAAIVADRAAALARWIADGAAEVAAWRALPPPRSRALQFTRRGAP